MKIPSCPGLRTYLFWYVSTTADDIFLHFCISFTYSMNLSTSKSMFRKHQKPLPLSWYHIYLQWDLSKTDVAQGTGTSRMYLKYREIARTFVIKYVWEDFSLPVFTWCTTLAHSIIPFSVRRTFLAEDEGDVLFMSRTILLMQTPQRRRCRKEKSFCFSLK